ncbi:hypothetical protein K470DRAFT_36445 [Piedraia hortae CBS 480.64]|uniref:Uncharacterized protein n=1 Tax=Piedraia hortae CBS 480.64 TaxID=1314780 RepID=A0A6A7C1V5_9PEZI|nr:hypothetical protein K470DRAFT_36445 [Piedraia hortae CBS 480.64]
MQLSFVVVAFLASMSAAQSRISNSTDSSPAAESSPLTGAPTPSPEIASTNGAGNSSLSSNYLPSSTSHINSTSSQSESSKIAKTVTAPAHKSTVFGTISASGKDSVNKTVLATKTAGGHKHNHGSSVTKTVESGGGEATMTMTKSANEGTAVPSGPKTGKDAAGLASGANNVFAKGGVMGWVMIAGFVGVGCWA